MASFYFPIKSPFKLIRYFRYSYKKDRANLCVQRTRIIFEDFSVFLIIKKQRINPNQNTNVCLNQIIHS